MAAPAAAKPRAAASMPTPLTGWLDLPNTYQQHLPGFSCFGCASDNPAGLRLRMQVHEKEAMFRAAPFVPSHAFSGFVHLMQGGLQGAAMDCVAEWATMYLSGSIGFTTKFELTFVKGVPAAPPSSEPDVSVAHVREASALPQLLPLSVHVVCAARAQTNPRMLVLDLRLEDAYGGGNVYSRGVVHMLLPSPAQVARLFGSDRATAQYVQDSLTALPRPNQAIMPATRPAAVKPAPPKPQSAGPTSAARPARAASAPPSTFAQLIECATLASPDEWVLLPDVLSAQIPHYSCWGCGSTNPRGLQCRYELNMRSGALRSFVHPSSALAGFPGMLHGGAALVPMDCLASWCVMVHAGQLGLTSHMKTLYIEAAPVPKQDQRAAATGHVHMHGDAATCASGSACGTSPALMSPSEAPYRLLIQGELLRILPGDRQGEVVVNLYDATSASASRAPRLCMSARCTFTFATASMVARLLGEQYVQPVTNAIKAMRQVLDEAKSKSEAKGVRMKEIRREQADSAKASSTKAKL